MMGDVFIPLLFYVFIYTFFFVKIGHHPKSLSMYILQSDIGYLCKQYAYMMFFGIIQY